MTPSSRLSQLRFGLKRLFAGQRAARAHHTPGLHHLLSIPLTYRLILLAKIDGADQRTIRRLLKVSKDDASLKSRRMRRAVAKWRQTIASPFEKLPESWLRDELIPDGDLTDPALPPTEGGGSWNRRHGAALEQRLDDFLWSDVAVCLIGVSVPLEVANLLTLHQRLILYCLLVAHLTQEETCEILYCNKWDIDKAIRNGLKAIGGQ